MKRLIKNGYIISEKFDSSKKYDIYIDKGVIKKIGQNLDMSLEGVDILDIDGKYILPGLIDSHCSICDPGQEFIEDIQTVSMSAANGGFTSIVCIPNTNPSIDNKTVVEYIVSKSKDYSLVNIFPFGSMSIGCKGEKISEIGEMNKVGIVGISDGDRTVLDTNLLNNVFKYSLMFGLPVITHCEDRNLSCDGVMNDGYISTILGLKGIPKSAEEVIVARNVALAESVGNKLHIAHVTTKGSVQLIREAKKRGVNVTCETCPHYFLLDESALLNYNTLAKVNPPLRTSDDTKAIIEGLLDGTIDCITSGHSPTKLEFKNVEFDKATYGISSLETSFVLSYTMLVHTKIMTFKELVNKMSLNPARIWGLQKKGVIAEGMDADLTVININEKYEINARKFMSKAKFSPFNGREVNCKVEYSIVLGNLIF